jgi:hypothetical protein
MATSRVQKKDLQGGKMTEDKLKLNITGDVIMSGKGIGKREREKRRRERWL